MSKTTLARITKTLLYFCIALALFFICVAHRIVPVMLLIPRADRFGFKYVLELCCWYVQALGGIYILFTLICMMRTLDSNPFLRRNVIHFRNMGVVALCLSGVALLAGLLYLTRYALYAISGVELVCALLSLVLAHVFQKAVEYREENDLVI